jgi:hypothetical protein
LDLRTSGERLSRDGKTALPVQAAATTDRQAPIELYFNLNKKRCADESINQKFAH